MENTGKPLEVGKSLPHLKTANMKLSEIRALFREIKKLRQKIQKANDLNSYAEFHKLHKEINTKLIQLTAEDFTVLSKMELFQLLDIMGSMRPVEPWRFLTISSRVAEQRGWIAYYKQPQ